MRALPLLGIVEPGPKKVVVHMEVEAEGLFLYLEEVVEVVAHDLETCQEMEAEDLFLYLEMSPVEVVAHDLETCQEVEAVLPADPAHHRDLLSELVVVVVHDLAVDLSLPLPGLPLPLV